VLVIVEDSGKMLKEVNEGFLLDSSLGDPAMVIMNGLVLLSCFPEFIIAS
jgi:hypothetical protein